MAGSRKQGRLPCFGAQSDGEESRPEEEKEMKTMRMVDFLRGQNEGGMKAKRKAKRPDLFVFVPPSSHSSASSASTAAPSNTTTASESFSPRSLVSRLLLSLPRPLSPAGGDGGGGQGSGCRLRFRRHCWNKQKERKVAEVEVEAEEEEGEGEGGELVGASVFESAAKTEEGKGARPLAPASAMGTEVGSESSDENRMELTVFPGRRVEEVSLNLGVSVALVFLLARGATEMNKMVELRAQMEMLLKDIKDEMRKKDISASTEVSDNNVSLASNICVNHNIGSSISLQNNRESYLLEGVPKELESDAQSNCNTAMGSRRYLKMDQMEAELEVELERLQVDFEGKDLLFLTQQDMEVASDSTNASESFNEDYEEGNNEIIEENDSYRYGVPPRELERRLHELLEARQQERIQELESALEYAERMLHEKEMEISWWRNTMRLVSQHKDEKLFS